MPKSISPLLRRKSSSPFTTAQRTKPGSRKSSLAEKEDGSKRLDDIGIVPRIPTDSRQDVWSLIRHIQEHTFDEIPDRAAGMNSERIAETLRFRSKLPPVVSIAHLHALSASSTDTERELARLVAMGKMRKVTIPGRGKGGSSAGAGVVLVEDWKRKMLQDEAVDEEVKQKYMALLGSNPTLQSVTVSKLNPTEIRSLVTAGFLTNPSALSMSDNLFRRSSGVPDGSIARAGSSFVTGTLAAVGGHGAIHDSGGGGSTLATKDNRASQGKPPPSMIFSLPGMGSYLKILTEAHMHLLFLLKQISPRYKEATMDFLEEKWNGNVPTDAASMAKRMRGEFSGVLPGQTRKFKQFAGLKFEWVLAECLGSGLVELFDTGSVGIGVRAT